MNTSTVPRDLVVLAVSRSLRGFGAGALSVVLAIDLAASGYSSLLIGGLLGLAMGAAAGWAVFFPGSLPWLSRRGLFLLGALGIALGGLLLWFDLASPWTLLPAIALGGIVAGGADISPLGALEQGALSAATSDRERTRSFATYNLAGYLGTALGALLAGPIGSIGPILPASFSGPHDATFLVYGLLGVALVPVYLQLSRSARGAAPTEAPRRLSPEHRRPILRLSGLFAIDAFGGGMTANALVAYFLLLRFSASPETIGVILSIANVAAGISLVLAVPLARRFGLINTMVFTHIPSSVLLILFAFTPTVALAGLVWVARATLSQMDVPTRQSYTQAIVPKAEGAAAAGYTTAARSAQAAGSPVAGALLGLGGGWLSGPFALAGSVKIAYDLAIYAGFRRRRPPEEAGEEAGAPR